MIDKNYSFENIPCNLCGGLDVLEVYPSTIPQDFSIEVTKRFAPADHISGNDRVVRCRHCGLVFVSPRMREDCIWSGYSEAVDQKYSAQEKERLATFNRAIRKIEDYVPGKGKILDVGCAAGFFLKSAKDAGWQAEGIEPNKGLAAFGFEKYGVAIRTVNFLSSNFPSNYFDALTFWDVLEHVADPNAYLKEAFRVLKPGGYIFVNFPDFGCPLARLTGKRWWFLSPVHLYYFTRGTLRKFLERNGFSVVKIECYWQTLALGYLFERLASYSKIISMAGIKLTKLLGLAKLPVRYYASQALAIARKPN